jgi:ferric-dicitrate binding protein FerR (iron transport regulator)
MNDRPLRDDIAFLERVMRLQDGSLNAEKIAALEREMTAAPEKRRLFVEAQIRSMFIHERFRLEACRPAQREPRIQRLPWFQWRPLVAAAVACIAVALWLTSATQPPDVAHLADVTGGVSVVRDSVRQQASVGFALQVGDELRVATKASAAVVYTDATRLVLAERTELKLGGDNERREMQLVTGRLAARVAKQPPDRPLIIRTPLATARVIGTEFTLEAAPRATRIEVSEGLVKMAHAGVDSAVEVAGGEFAVAMPGSELLAGLQPPVERTSKSVPVDADRGGRDFARQPFAPASPWNRCIGSGAAYADVQSPALDLARHGAVVLPASHDRPVVVARPGDPQGRIVGRYEEKTFATVPIPASAFRDSPRSDWFNGTLIVADRAVGYELFGARRRDGDIEASLCIANDLCGAGVPPAAGGQTFSGLPLVAGLIREGELERGIPHALAVAALHVGLSRRGPDGQPFVWPARHMPIESKKIEMLGAAGNVCYGTLLAISRDVDIAQLGVGNSGPAFEIARALQDYGAYVTHSYPAAPAQNDWVQPHIQFFAELPEGTDFQKLAAEVSKLARHLKVVSNNLPAK